ncbi:MAG TPA: hypothetical protein DC054_01580, partial [Blastocatellia bacterium]|nr:hypothetical protein [Blastocatellia bacterium]
MRSRVITLGIVLLLGQAQFVLARTQDSKKNETSLQLTPQQWQQDLQFLARELPARHKNAFHTVSREQFEKSVSDLSAQIPNLQPHEIVVGFMRIIASVSDAHTELSGFGTGFHRFPLSLYWFGKELRVTRIASAYKRGAGARVVQIGDLSVADVTARLDQVVAHENDYWVRLLDAGFMPYAEILQALKIIPDLKTARWTFADSAGKQFSLDIQPVAADEKIDWVSASPELPLYRQRPDEQFWFTYLPEAQTMYVNFRGYRESFDKHADELLSSIKEHSPQRVVIDMRQNRGGDFTKVRGRLLPGLKQNSLLRKPGALFIVTGRATQSAAVVNTIDFRKEMNAIIVGEPTGGRPNGYSEH